MAIQKTLDSSKFGLELTDAYHKVDDISINNKNVQFSINAYANKVASDASLSALNTVGMNVPLSVIEQHEGDTFIAKIYAFVKNVHPDYAEDTTDV